MLASELGELATFLSVAKHRSFNRAALERGVASSAVSHSVRKLEERVGVRLLNRTTRSVSLTDAGERFVSELSPAFDQIGRAMDGLNAYRGTPFGLLRITIPASIAPYVLSDVLGPLISNNPGLQLDVETSDRLVDITKEGFDAGIRFGEQLSQDMVAVRLKTRLRFAVVGSPEYLRGRKIPKTPGDLRDHACIRYKFPSGAIFNWEFERDGKSVAVEVNGPMITDGQELMVEAALQGCGLAYVWDDRVRDELNSGRLIRCLADWCRADDSLFIYYPSRRYVSAGLRALIDKLRD